MNDLIGLKGKNYSTAVRIRHAPVHSVDIGMPMLHTLKREISDEYRFLGEK
jgi:hypothetical protein